MRKCSVAIKNVKQSMGMPLTFVLVLFKPSALLKSAHLREHLFNDEQGDASPRARDT